MGECYFSRTPNGAYGGPCGRPNCDVCRPPAATRSLEEINAENRRLAAKREREAQLRREQQEREALFAHGCSLVGSRIWDGGRFALPTSDIDVLINASPEVVDRFRPSASAFVDAAQPLYQALLRYPTATVDLVSGTQHWSLTGREERQCVVLSGARPVFVPAPRNAPSAMIRRAALKIMGVKTCIPSGDVEDTGSHSLFTQDATINALRWVQARASHWEDAALGELAGRVDEAMRAGVDVREAL